MGGASRVVNVEAIVGPDRSLGAATKTSAFERLFLAEYATVVRIANRVLADAAEAEDVAQEVFLAFHRRHRAEAPFAAAWLRAAAAHAALNAVRSRKRRSRREATSADADRAVDPHEEVEANERRREVREALARLPAKPAAALALRYGGLSYAEVGAALGVNANGVGTLLRRAEAALRKEMAK